MEEHVSPSQDVTKPMISRRRRIMFRCATIAIAVVFALVVAEIVLRITGYVPKFAATYKSFHVKDPKYVYRGKPNFTGRFSTDEFDVIIAHDENGFRVHENKPLPVAQNAIFVLGDSFTWGWGVDQGEVFTDQLQKHIPRRRVVNLGRNGAGTVVEYHLFKDFAVPDLVRGDLVVVAFGDNDFDDCFKKDFLHVVVGEDRVIREQVTTLTFGYPIRGFIKEHSRLGNLLAYMNDVRKLRKRYVGADKRHMKMWAKNVFEGDLAYVVDHYLRKIYSSCHERGAKMILAYVPGKYTLNTNIDLANRASMHNTLQQLSRDAPWIYLDLFESFLSRAAKSGKPCFFDFDGHFTAEGHRVYGRLLADRLTPHLATEE